MNSALPPFDRLAYMDLLTAGGIPEQHARAHAAALNGALHDSVATKMDVSSLRTELKTDMTLLRGELKTDMSLLRTELKTDIEIFKRDITIRMGSMIMALGGVLIAIKYFG